MALSLPQQIPDGPDGQMVEFQPTIGVDVIHTTGWGLVSDVPAMNAVRPGRLRVGIYSTFNQSPPARPIPYELRWLYEDSLQEAYFTRIAADEERVGGYWRHSICRGDSGGPWTVMTDPRNPQLLGISVCTWTEQPMQPMAACGRTILNHAARPSYHREAVESTIRGVDGS